MFCASLGYALGMETSAQEAEGNSKPLNTHVLLFSLKMSILASLNTLIWA